MNNIKFIASAFGIGFFTYITGFMIGSTGQYLFLLFFLPVWFMITTFLDAFKENILQQERYEAQRIK